MNSKRHERFKEAGLVGCMKDSEKFEYMNEWISVKDRMPPLYNNERGSYVLAYHTIHGIGVAWFWNYGDDGHVEEMEEDFQDKYLCSCWFILNKQDGNYCISDETDIDIFEHSPHFKNLGSVTHWMPLPKPPRLS